MPVIVTLISALVGNVLGYTVFKDVVVSLSLIHISQTDPVSISCMHASDRIIFIGCQYGGSCSFRAG